MFFKNHLPRITSSGGHDVSFKEGMIAYTVLEIGKLIHQKTSGFDKNHRGKMTSYQAGCAGCACQLTLGVNVYKLVVVFWTSASLMTVKNSHQPPCATHTYIEIDRY